MEEKEIIEKICSLIYYLKKDEILEYCDFCEREQCLGMMEDYEIEDMDEFFKKFPFMKLFSYGAIYELQKYYNSEYLCAGWCGCTNPERLAKMLDQIKKENNNENRI